MDLRQLRYFVAVAEELSFTRAAGRLHIAQSALSHQIAQLEREHRVPLFDRTSRSVQLAAAGQLLLPRARAILSDAEAAAGELAELVGVVSGRLRIGLISTSGGPASRVEQSLAAFHRRHPGVEIAIQDTGSAQMADAVRAGELDLAFVGLFADQVPADLVYRLLGAEPLVAIAPAGHPLAGRAEVAVAELVAHGAFVEMRPSSGVRTQVDLAFARAGVQRSIAFELAGSEAVARFVGLGFGIAVVPQSAAAARPELVAVPLDDPGARHPVGLIHRRPRPSTPSARAFLAVLQNGAG